MNKRLISIVVASVMAVAAVIMVRAYIKKIELKYVKKEEKIIQITVAKQDIPKGSTILPNMVGKISWPEQYLQPGVLHNPNYAIGKIAVIDILKGEMIQKTKLTHIPRADASLAVRLPEGKRGFTIIIDSLSAVIGQIKPGDHIDVIGVLPFTQQIEGKSVTELVTATFLQNILVMDRRPSGKDFIFILALAPQEAALLSHAASIGSLRLTLRHALDGVLEDVYPVDTDTLWRYILNKLIKGLGEDSDKQVDVEALLEKEPPDILEIFHGIKKEDMVVE